MKSISFVLCASILASFLFISCSSSSFINLGDLKSELNLTDFPTQAGYPDADEVVLKEAHDVHVILDEDYNLVTVENFTKIVKMFKNVAENASGEIDVFDGQTLNSVSARTIKADGGVIELKPEDFHTITGDEEGYVFYSDMKKVKFTFPAVEKDCITELHFSIYSKYPFLQDVWAIQGTDPKLENTYKLTAPIILVTPKSKGGYDWTWRYKAYNCFLDEPTQEKDIWNDNRATIDKTVTFCWAEKDVPGFEGDPMMPSSDNYTECVRFSPSGWSTWDDVAGWYHKYHFADQLIITDEISIKAKELTKDCPTDVEKLKKVYAFIQTLRYVAIDIGQGGYTPSQPAEVLRRQYGDCKDKSTLLIALLRSLGLDAKPVLVLTRDHGKLDPDFPCWRFNHMIVKATMKDGTVYWMDPTVDHCSLGEIPWWDRGISVLVLNDDGTSRMEFVPPSAFGDNNREISINVVLASQDEADYDITMIFKGQDNFVLRCLLSEKTHDEVVKFCKSLVAENFLTAEVTGYTISDFDAVDSDFVFNFKIKVPGAVEHQGDLLFVNPDPVRLTGDWTWLARDKRLYDIEFDCPRTINESISLDLPKDKYTIRTLPNDLTQVKKGLYYSETTKDNGDGSVKITKSFSIQYKLFKSDAFNEIKTFMESMRKASGEKVILTIK